MWPGSWLAANIVAQAAIAGDMADVALDVIAAARQARADDDLPIDQRCDLANRAAEAHLGLGNVRDALIEAFAVVDAGGVFGAWPSMVEAAVDNSDWLASVLGLALVGDGEDFVAAVATSLPPEKTAELCAAYLVAGGTNAGAVSAGILAAVMRELDQLAAVVVEHIDLLDTDQRRRLAARVRRGHADALADEIAAPAPARV